MTSVGYGQTRSFYSPYRQELHGWWQSINGFTDSPETAILFGTDYPFATLEDSVQGLRNINRVGDRPAPGARRGH